MKNRRNSRARWLGSKSQISTSESGEAEPGLAEQSLAGSIRDRAACAEGSPSCLHSVVPRSWELQAAPGPNLQLMGSWWFIISVNEVILSPFG